MLETIELPGSGRQTTRLGFGCSGMMGGISQGESLRLLETAYEAGIRHFDVAPSYGYGQAERCVGLFLRGKTDVTVTTKYGILAPRRAGMLEIVRTAVRPLVRRFPGLRQKAAQAAAALKSQAQFSAAEGHKSLEHSLRELGVERVDLWLLHEAAVENLVGSNLLPMLQQAQRHGKIGMYGVGSERDKLAAVWKQHRDYCPVVQFEWSILALKSQFPGAFAVQHRVIAGALPALRAAMERDPDLCRRWSDEFDADLSQADKCAALLLNLALLRNREGIVLFSSRNAARIHAGVRAAESEQWKQRARQFHDLLGRQ